MTMRLLCTPKEILSASSHEMDRTPSSVGRHLVGPYYHMIRSYIARNARVNWVNTCHLSWTHGIRTASPSQSMALVLKLLVPKV